MRIAGAGRGIVSVGLLAFLAACQSEPMGGPLSLETGADSPVSLLQRINEAGAKCWMSAHAQPFRGLNMIPELDTTAGRPRLLILREGKAGGLPLLVIEAAGSPVKVETYGPLAGSRTGARVNADIMRWSSGPAEC